MGEDDKTLLCVMQKGEGKKRGQTKPCGVAAKLSNFYLMQLAVWAYFISSLSSSYLGERRCE